MPIVRLAQPYDLPELIAMCRELHAENGILTMSDARVSHVIGAYFTNSGGLIGVIDDGTGTLEGAIVLRLGGFWYSDDTILEELFSFVRPEYRKSKNAKALITFAKASAEQIGIPLVIGIISDHRTAAKIELYRRQLGEPTGAFFVSRTNHPVH